MKKNKKIIKRSAVRMVISQKSKERRLTAAGWMRAQLQEFKMNKKK